MLEPTAALRPQHSNVPTGCYWRHARAPDSYICHSALSFCFSTEGSGLWRRDQTSYIVRESWGSVSACSRRTTYDVTGGVHVQFTQKLLL